MNEKVRMVTRHTACLTNKCINRQSSKLESYFGRQGCLFNKRKRLFLTIDGVIIILVPVCLFLNRIALMGACVNYPCVDMATIKVLRTASTRKADY